MILFIPDKTNKGSLYSYFVMTDSGHVELNQVDKGGFKILDLIIARAVKLI